MWRICFKSSLCQICDEFLYFFWCFLFKFLVDVLITVMKNWMLSTFEIERVINSHEFKCQIYLFKLTKLHCNFQARAFLISILNCTTLSQVNYYVWQMIWRMCVTMSFKTVHLRRLSTFVIKTLFKAICQYVIWLGLK